jgi:hypothetical protein
MKKKLESLDTVAWRGLFCLFFLPDGFLCAGLSHAAGLPPILESRPLGILVGGAFKLVDDTSDGLRDVGYRNLEVTQTTPRAENATILEGLVESVGSLDVELPLLQGELAGDVVDNLTFLETAGGEGLQKVDERSQQGTDNNTPGRNQGDKDGIGHILDRESLLQGMGWALVFTAGYVIGSWIGAKIGVGLAYALPLGNVFRQNV